MMFSVSRLTNELSDCMAWSISSLNITCNSDSSSSVALVKFPQGPSRYPIVWVKNIPLWVGSGVTLPVVVDEANGYEPHIICRIVVAIEALGIKAVQLLANKVVQVLCHVGFQVVFLCLLRLMVPVSMMSRSRTSAMLSIVPFSSVTQASIVGSM